MASAGAGDGVPAGREAAIQARRGGRVPAAGAAGPGAAAGGRGAGRVRAAGGTGAVVRGGGECARGVVCVCGVWGCAGSVAGVGVGSVLGRYR